MIVREVYYGPILTVMICVGIAMKQTAEVPHGFALCPFDCVFVYACPAHLS